MQNAIASLIIPSLDRQEIVFDTVKQFEFQTAKQFELIVIDQSDSVSVRLNEYISSNFQFVYKRIKEKGLPNARNTAASLAKGEILIFVDDDILPDKNLIVDFIKELDQNSREDSVIGGRIQENNSGIMNTNPEIVGGKITCYGKPIRNFNSEKSGNCEWVAGGNFAVRKKFFLKIKGFDKNFIGNAMLEDCDFCFTVKEKGGQVYYSPRPFIEHLRVKTGGTRQINRSKGMFYRAHNTIYFLRKHGLKLRLITAFLYLNAVAIKDLFLRRHGISAIFWNWMGYFKGLIIKLPV